MRCNVRIIWTHMHTHIKLLCSDWRACWDTVPCCSSRYGPIDGKLIYVVDSPKVILDYNLQSLSPDLQHTWWLIFIIWLLHCLQMPPLYPLGPTHPDTNIISIYTQPAWCDAYSTVCCAKVKVSSSRAMWCSSGRYGPAGNPGASSCIQTPSW